MLGVLGQAAHWPGLLLFGIQPGAFGDGLGAHRGLLQGVSPGRTGALTRVGRRGVALGFGVASVGGWLGGLGGRVSCALLLDRSEGPRGRDCHHLCARKDTIDKQTEYQ